MLRRVQPLSDAVGGENHAAVCRDGLYPVAGRGRSRARAKEERTAGLRRRIATYRRLLAEAVPSDTARVYLAEIAKAEAELARIESDDDKRE
jgi:hypothetical protein